MSHCIVRDHCRAVALLLSMLAACGAPARRATDVQQAGDARTPGPRTSHSLVYDEERRTVVLVDGYSPFPGASHPPLTELWGWDGARWRQAGPAAGT